MFATEDLGYPRFQESFSSDHFDLGLLGQGRRKREMSSDTRWASEHVGFNTGMRVQELNCLLLYYCIKKNGLLGS